MAIFETIVPFTKKWEGGLSRAKTDKASKKPAPYTYKGFSDWHTNKGVTWETFSGNAKKLGYELSENNFFLMPEWIWNKIAKLLYWDILSLDTCKSEAVAIVIFSWQWKSGYAWMPRISKYLKTKNIDWKGAYWLNKKIIITKDVNQISEKLNLLVEKEGEQKIFEDLIEEKRQYLINLNQPDNINGWLRRLEDLKKFGNELIKKKSQPQAK